MSSAEFEALRPQLEVILLTKELTGNVDATLCIATQLARSAIEIVRLHDWDVALRLAERAIHRFEEWQHEQPRG